MRDERCETCKHYREREPVTNLAGYNFGNGECRRYAPGRMRNAAVCWPSVSYDEWCGEYESKQGEDK